MSKMALLDSTLLYFTLLHSKLALLDSALLSGRSRGGKGGANAPPFGG